MTEDPLERIEREEREKKNRNGSLKTATIVLAVAPSDGDGAVLVVPMHQTQWGPERPLPPPVSLASTLCYYRITCCKR